MCTGMESRSGWTTRPPSLPQSTGGPTAVMAVEEGAAEDGEGAGEEGGEIAAGHQAAVRPQEEVEGGGSSLRGRGANSRGLVELCHSCVRNGLQLKSYQTGVPDITQAFSVCK